MAFFMLVFILVLVSPRVDAQNRGFVACTKQMAENLVECNNKKICMITKILDNTLCDIKVITDGIKFWINGEQSSPFANYIFKEQINEPE